LHFCEDHKFREEHNCSKHKFEKTSRYDEKEHTVDVQELPKETNVTKASAEHTPNLICDYCKKQYSKHWCIKCNQHLCNDCVLKVHDYDYIRSERIEQPSINAITTAPPAASSSSTTRRAEKRQKQSKDKILTAFGILALGIVLFGYGYATGMFSIDTILFYIEKITSYIPRASFGNDQDEVPSAPILPTPEVRTPTVPPDSAPEEVQPPPPVPNTPSQGAPNQNPSDNAKVGIFHVNLPCDKLITTITKEYSLRYGIKIEATEHCNWNLGKQISDKYDYAIYLASAASELKFFGMKEHSGRVSGETNFDTKNIYVMKTNVDSYVLSSELSHMWLFKKGYPADVYLNWVNSKSECFNASGKQDCYVFMRFSGGGTMYKVMPFYEGNLPSCTVSPDGIVQIIYNANQQQLCDIPAKPTEQEPPSKPVEHLPPQQETTTAPDLRDYLTSDLRQYLGDDLLQLTNELANKKGVTHDELVNYALALINKDRKESNLSPITLHQNDYSQFHADDMVHYGYIAHWTSDGMKPYMGYTTHGGQGAVSQNAAYQYCIPYCSFNPIISILQSQYGMMYEDFECCKDGHKANILDKWHSGVSIGIAYNEKYFAFVQDFENSYITWTKPISYDSGIINLNGITEFNKISHISVYYDPTPKPLTAKELMNTPRSYDHGEFVGAVLSPLPEGYTYIPQNHVQVVASRWESGGNGSFSITFNLYDFYKAHGNGVYTIYLYSEQGEDWVELTSYSFFIK
jgi:uncharacterized protein YkwD